MTSCELLSDLRIAFFCVRAGGVSAMITCELLSDLRIAFVFVRAK